MTRSSFLTNLFHLLSLLSSLAFSLPFPAPVAYLNSCKFFTSLLFPALFTSRLCSLPRFLHVPSLLTSPIFSGPYFFHFSSILFTLLHFLILFTSPLFSLFTPVSRFPLFVFVCVFQCAARPRCTRWRPPLLFARCLPCLCWWPTSESNHRPYR